MRGRISKCKTGEKKQMQLLNEHDKSTQGKETLRYGLHKLNQQSLIKYRKTSQNSGMLFAILKKQHYLLYRM